MTSPSLSAPDGSASRGGRGWPRFLSNLREAPFELKAFVAFALLATLCSLARGLFLYARVTAETWRAAPGWYATLDAYLLFDVPSLYVATVWFALATVYYRTPRLWYGLLFIHVVVGAGAFAELYTASGLPLGPGDAFLGLLPYPLVYALLLPFFWFGVVGSPRVRSYCGARAWGA